jgi:hypothetical protein
MPHLGKVLKKYTAHGLAYVCCVSMQCDYCALHGQLVLCKNLLSSVLNLLGCSIMGAWQHLSIKRSVA